MSSSTVTKMNQFEIQGKLISERLFLLACVLVMTV